ncbi:hypothetical protein [Halorubrum yunnanense]|uniref:Uncharacterized protein n=1 Tax=Halorubrum yunnanense TaxID=1526162 RepID=A0ABD5YEI6_9EURY|nr:hypothetical protein [Halorubrum yunnanense]
MFDVDTHEEATGDDEDPERPVRVIEGHAVRFNEYRCRAGAQTGAERARGPVPSGRADRCRAGARTDRSRRRATGRCRDR